uniref:Uncharacterized protein n=1 Tax=Romanomermis culicivorax TaxID=13658 RepID=A0A915KR30_ROMCU
MKCKIKTSQWGDKIACRKNHQLVSERKIDWPLPCPKNMNLGQLVKMTSSCQIDQALLKIGIHFPLGVYKFHALRLCAPLSY